MKRKKIFFGIMLLSMLWTLLFAMSVDAATPVETHGKLSIRGTKIVDNSGKAFQLKGVSTHGLSWYPEYVSKEAFASLRDEWGANTVRLAMYTAEYNGYCTGDASNRTKLKKLIDKGVKAATDLGMYVIIDWHILSDNNPNTYKNKSLSFFKEMAEKYKNYNNVLYEICNEPNSGTSWSQIKSYANSVIAAIRKIDSDAIIIVGTPTWSQDVDDAAKSPITGYKNIAYSFHFYANTHKESYRTKLENAVKAGLPVFVSEFGICDASGGGSVNKSEANQWIKLLNRYQISYICWNLSNKNETSALIKSSCKKLSGWSLSDLKESGKWLVTVMKGDTDALGSSTSGEADTSGQTDGSISGQTDGTGETNASGQNGSTGTGATASGETGVKATKKNCRIQLKKEKTWKSGKRYYTLYRLTIRNKSNSTISSWKVRIKFQKAIKKSQYWNGKMTFKGKTVTIKPLSWNKSISKKGKITDIGFIVSTTSAKNSVKTAVFVS